MKLNEKVIKVGNSKGIYIPTKVAKLLKWELGDEVELNIIDGVIRVEKTVKR